MNNRPAPRAPFRVLLRHRDGYADQPLTDVQLQHLADGTLVWAQTFSDHQQAERFADTVRDDLLSLPDHEFRQKHAVPSRL